VTNIKMAHVLRNIKLVYVMCNIQQLWGLLKDAVKITECQMIGLINELERMWKEMAVAQFN
jgi:hypothetical protein